MPPPPSSDWRAEYLSNLQAQNVPPDDAVLVEACEHLFPSPPLFFYAQLTRTYTGTALSSKVIEVQTETALLRASLKSSFSSSQSIPTALSDTRPSSSSAASSPASSSSDAQLRADLAEALRSRDNALARLHSLETETDRLRARAAADTKRVRQLVEREALLTRNLRDRESELLEKGKLVAVRLPSVCPFLSVIDMADVPLLSA